MIQAMAQSPYTVRWEMDGFSYRAGLRLNGDRFYLPEEGQGAVQQGLRSWEVTVESDGTDTWEGPYPGGIPQLPYLDSMRANPQFWGPGELITQDRAFRRESVSGDEELWVAELPAGGQKMEINLGRPIVLREFRLWVQKRASAHLPTRFAYAFDAEGRSRTTEGTYTWAEPVLPEVPPMTAETELGLAGIWLGQTRDHLEPISFDPIVRSKDPDGSEWVGDDYARSVKYDPTGRVVIISQSRAGLINGLRIGDDAAAVERYLGPATATTDSALVYRFPLGSRLEVYMHEGKVTKFWAVAPGY